MTDVLGREIADNLIGIKDIVQQMLGKTQPIKGSSKDSEAESTEALTEEMAKLKKLFEFSVKIQAKQFKLAIAQLKLDKKGEKLDVKTIKSYDRLEKAISNEVKKIGAGGGNKGGGGGRGKSGGGLFPDDNTNSKAIKGLQKYSVQVQDVKENTVGMGKAVMASFANWTGGGNILGSIFDGIIKDEYNFQMGMRAIAYETEGVTNASEDVQKSWGDIGKTVAITGKSMGETQKILTNQLKKGSKSRKEELKLTNTSLNLSTMIGSNAEDTAGIFHEWHVQMGMSNTQMAEVSRGAQRVARATGITGDNLTAVIKKTQTFVKQMRDAGTLTAEAANNMLMISANAEKLGVGEKMAELQSGMASGADLLNKSSKETRSLLLAAATSQGLQNELLYGNITKNKDAMKKMTTGLKQTMNQIAGVDVESKNLTSDQIFKANMKLQSRGIAGIGEAQRIVKTMELSSMSISEAMAAVEKDLKDVNKTEKEKIALREKLRDLEMDTAGGLLNRFSELADQGKSVQESMDEAFKGMKDADFDKMGIKGDKLGGLAKLMADKLKEASGGKTDLTSKVSKAIGSGDTAQIRGVIDELNEGMQGVKTEQKKSLNPVEAAQQKANEINEKIRGHTGTMVTLMMTMVGGQTLMLAQLAASLLTNQVTGTGIKNIGKYMWNSPVAKKAFGATGSFGKGIGKAFSKFGGGAAAGSAAGAATSAAGSAAGAAVTGGSGVADIVTKTAPELKGIKPSTATDILKGGWGLVKAAAALAVVAVGIMALGGALMMAYKLLMSLTGATSMDFVQMGVVILAILTSVGAVAGAIFLAEKFKVFDMIGELGKKGLSMAKDLILGGIVLIILSAGIIAIGAAIIWLAKGILSLTGLSAEEAGKTAIAVAMIVGSVAVIALAVIASAVGLAILSLALPYIPIVIGLMFLGSLALIALTPAVVELSVSIIDMAEETMATVADPEKATKVVGMMADLMMSTGMIIAMVMLASVVLAGLGAMSWITWTLIPLMWLGSKALNAMTWAVISLCLSIVNMTRTTMFFVGGESGISQISKDVESVGKLLEVVGASVNSIQDKIFSLRSMDFFSMMISMSKLQGLTSFLRMFGSWLYFGLIIPLSWFPSSKNVQTGIDQLSDLNKMLTSLIAVLDTMDSLIGKLSGRKPKDISAFIPDISKMVADTAVLADNIAMSGKPGAMAIPSAIRGGVGTSGPGSVSTVGVDRLHDGINREQANRSSAGSTKEMSQIAEATLQQVALLEKIEANTSKLADALSNDKVSVARAGEPTSNLPKLAPSNGAVSGGWGALNSSARQSDKSSMAIVWNG